MNIVLLGKSLVGGAAAVGASVFTLWQTGVIGKQPTESIVEDPDIVVYAKVSTTETSNPASKKINTTENTINYQCQLNENKDSQIANKLFKCDIKQLKDPTDSKNQIDYEDFEADISGDKVLEKDKIFQISFQSKKSDWKNDGTDKIDIVSTTEKDKKYGTVDVWFVFDKDKAIKTTQFIGQSKATATTGTELSDYKCSWEDKEESNVEDCKVYVFSDTSSLNQESSTEYSALTFKNNTTETKEIKEHHHYRIVWTTTTEAKDNTNMTIFAKATKSDGTTTTSKETLKFKKVKPSFLAEDKIAVIKDKTSS